MELLKDIFAIFGVVFTIGWTIWKFCFDNKVKLAITSLSYCVPVSNLKDAIHKETGLFNGKVVFNFYNYGSVPLVITEYKQEQAQFYWQENYGKNRILPHEILSMEVPFLFVKNEKINLLKFRIGDGREFVVPKRWIDDINDNIQIDKIDRQTKNTRRR